MSRLHSSEDANRLLDQVVKSIRAQPIPDFPDPEIVWPDPESSAPAKPKLRWFQSSGNLRLAAGFLLLVMFGLAPFVIGFDSSRKAFAQVQSALQQTQSVSFRITTKHNDKEVSSARVWVAPPHRVRAEIDGEIHILDLQKAKSLWIRRESRDARIQPIFDPAMMQKRVMGPLSLLMQPNAGTDVDVEDKVVGGTRFQVFRMKWDGADTTVRATVEENLPVYMLMERGEDARGKKIVEVLDEFQFQSEVDATLFSLDAPPGFFLEVVSPRSDGQSMRSEKVSPDHGLGPVQFGMTKKEVIGLLGEPDRIVTREGMIAVVDGDVPILTPEGNNVRFLPADPKFTIDECIYDSRGFRIHVSSKDGVTKMACFAAGTFGPASRSFEGKTPEGISIGSTWKQVIDTYGEPKSKLDGVSASYPGWNFNFVDRKLRVIRIHPPPQR